MHYGLYFQHVFYEFFFEIMDSVTLLLSVQMKNMTTDPKKEEVEEKKEKVEEKDKVAKKED